MYLPLKRGTYEISSGFGPRWGTMHQGLDFAAPVGTPIYAPFDGKVIQGAERAPGTVGGFGNWVWLEGSTEPYDFIVGHMQHSSILVKAGDTVKAGQKIAEVGNEGQSTGAHAHCELWEQPGRLGGRAIDPAPFWGDNATNPGDTPAPAPSGTIFGIDISDHQNGLALSKAVRDGMQFVILRLCDGTYVDKAFTSHLADAEAQGLLVATYWYLRAPSEGTTIAQQVDVIDRQLGGRKDLGVWIDVESVGPGNNKLLTKGDVLAYLGKVKSPFGSASGKATKITDLGMPASKDAASSPAKKPSVTSLTPDEERDLILAGLVQLTSSKPAPAPVATFDTIMDAYKAPVTKQGPAPPPEARRTTAKSSLEQFYANLLG